MNYQDISKDGRKVVRDLLTANKHAFQYCNAIAGMDFEKPFAVYTFFTSFTVNSIRKLITYSEPWKAVVFFRDCRRNYTWSNRELFAAHIGSNSTRFTATRGDLETTRTRFYFTGIDHCWGVGDFENKRKANTSPAFVVVQRAAYVRNVSKVAPPEYLDAIKAGERFERCGKSYSYWKVRRVERSGEEIKAAKGSTFYSSREPVEVDASGFSSAPFVEDRKRRAFELRKQREKAAAVAYDCSAEEGRVADQVQALRIDLANYVMTYTGERASWSDYKAFDSFASAVTLLRRHQDRRMAGTYTSVEQIRDNFSRIEEYIASAYRIMNPEEAKEA